jgi:hypothetical protein
MVELDSSAICVAVHPALDQDCPICNAVGGDPCIEDGEELPVYAAHIGRTTGGADLVVENQGDGVLVAIDN